MTVKFLLKGYHRKNFDDQNLKDVIGSINDPVIQEAFHADEERIIVDGPVHRTQLTSDNPEHYFWIRLIVHDQDGQIIPSYGAVHVFMCYQLWHWNGRNYRLGNCIVPPSYPDQPDIADIRRLYGYWRPVRFTLGIQQAFNQVKSSKPYVPRKRHPVIIIDPKTGKKVE